jgi:deoxyribonuclease V
VHPWAVSPAEARALQERLASHVHEVEPRHRLRLVAGVDAAYPAGQQCHAAVVVWDLETQAVVEERTATRTLTFPYVPGLLSFREAPALLAALARLETVPDALLFDGQGRAHPRRLGVACHVGVLLDCIAVGCAKSRLCGTHAEPGERRGSRAALRDGRERLGTVLRTRDGVRPVYVSVGHRIDLTSAEALVLRCTTRYRLPEPIRLADHLTRVT